MQFIAPLIRWDVDLHNGRLPHGVGLVTRHSSNGMMLLASALSGLHGRYRWDSHLGTLAPDRPPNSPLFVSLLPIPQSIFFERSSAWCCTHV